jgi:transposase InsO family protein
MKRAWIAAQRQDVEQAGTCAALNVSVSGYRAWQAGGKADRKRLTDAQLLALIRSIHVKYKGTYGSPRMVDELRDMGFPTGKERVERLMRENGIRARRKRRFKATTDSKHTLPVEENLLDRNFSPEAPNQAWTADIVTDALTRWLGSAGGLRRVCFAIPTSATSRRYSSCKTGLESIPIHK